MTIDLQAAAERVLAAEYTDATDLCELARAYAAELDATPVDEEWLTASAIDVVFREEGGRSFFFECGVRVLLHDGPEYRFTACGCHNERYHNPTRGLIRTLQRIGGGM